MKQLKFLLFLLTINVFLLQPVLASSSLSREEQLRERVLSANMEEIYGTPGYQNTVNGWLVLYAPGYGKFQGMFGKDMIAVLDKVANPSVFTGFAKDLLVISTQFGWDAERELIARYLSGNVSRLKNPSGIIQRAIVSSRLQPGTVAPSIVANRLPGQAMLLVFYESGCDHCNQVITQLIRDYEKYRSKGIRVVTISSDEDKEVYEYHSKNFPWVDKLCDFKGYSGANFMSYGVMGTPSIYVVDGNGIIQGQYTGLNELEILLQEKNK